LIFNPIGRREFIATLVAAPFFSSTALGKARQTLAAEHFYFADLNQGTVVFPKGRVIDRGQPGSLMKLIASAALLEENLPASTQILDCRGAITIAGQHYICRYPHGPLALTEALGQSCNVFFAHSSTQLNSHCFWHYLKTFGLVQASMDSDIIIKHLRHGSANLILGIANGFELDSVQILQLVTSIGTRGQLPQLCYADNPAHKITLPKLTLHEHTWDVLNRGMQIAAQRGTAKSLDRENKLHLAVKTGTTIHGKTFQSWLAGYFPYESPHYSFCLRATAGTSYDQAVPLAKKILFSRSWT